jgi:hypothetical protein
MKRNLSSTICLTAVFFLMLTNLSLSLNAKSAIPVIKDNLLSNSKDIQESPSYKLKVKKIFKDDQKALIEEKLIKLNAPFNIEQVNYDEKTLIIKLHNGAKIKEAISVFEKLLGEEYAVTDYTEYSK